ncbi:MAG: tRNA-(ms[2]io[6]A)-hydroxylase [Bryobacterales bacterium]|nr:tRNA-(ms[2]io[6]A)-hydroxylase [Bryobacterales bacterium]
MAVAVAPDILPLRALTPPAWAEIVLQDPVALLIDHAFLEKKAATNALDLLTLWPEEFFPEWAQVMTAVARDEAAHLAQVTRILLRRGGRLARVHKNPYANALRLLVRKGTAGEVLDRLLISAIIELRSCERFSVLAAHCTDEELAVFYRRLFASEKGHFQVFLKLANAIAPKGRADDRWNTLLDAEARILAQQELGPRIHSGCPA